MNTLLVAGEAESSWTQDKWRVESRTASAARVAARAQGGGWKEEAAGSGVHVEARAAPDAKPHYKLGAAAESAPAEAAAAPAAASAAATKQPAAAVAAGVPTAEPAPAPKPRGEASAAGHAAVMVGAPAPVAHPTGPPAQAETTDEEDSENSWVCPNCTTRNTELRRAGRTARVEEETLCQACTEPRGPRAGFMARIMYTEGARTSTSTPELEGYNRLPLAFGLCGAPAHRRPARKKRMNTPGKKALAPPPTPLALPQATKKRPGRPASTCNSADKLPASVARLLPHAGFVSPPPPPSGRAVRTKTSRTTQPEAKPAPVPTQGKPAKRPRGRPRKNPVPVPAPAPPPPPFALPAEEEAVATEDIVPSSKRHRAEVGDLIPEWWPPLWAELDEMGWTMEDGRLPSETMYFPRGVNRSNGKMHVDYFVRAACPRPPVTTPCTPPCDHVQHARSFTTGFWWWGGFRARVSHF